MGGENWYIHVPRVQDGIQRTNLRLHCVPAFQTAFSEVDSGRCLHAPGDPGLITFFNNASYQLSNKPHLLRSRIKIKRKLWEQKKKKKFGGKKKKKKKKKS